MSESLFGRTLSGVFRAVNRRRQWYELPLPLALLNLDALRIDLREHNLHDPMDTAEPEVAGDPPPEALRARTPGGFWNDVSHPGMGTAGSRFGRNVPLASTAPRRASGFDPSPREVSLSLMTRDGFKPATILNSLAGAWIQFQNHGWFFHGPGDPDDTFEVPLADDDDWPERPMRIRRTIPAPGQPAPAGRSCTYRSTESHWWDGSQIYGSTTEQQRNLRTFRDGKLNIQSDGRLVPEPDVPGVEVTGFSENWWVGLSMLHTLFTLEHNAICDHLKRAYPSWDDQRLYETAWLVNAAVMAKIHTVEWTPGILPHRALQIGMSANWWGLLGERFKKRYGRVSESETLSGIVGSATDHHSAPFALTEEFVSVYRLHALIADDWKFFSLDSGQLLEERTFTEIQGVDTLTFMDKVSMPDLFYSFGISHPGAITLHNFPRALQNLKRIDGQLLDMATLDIARDRERGVPRYNDFRELLRMPRVRTFEDLTANRVWAREIRDVYKGDIDRVDLQVGLHAETPPPGFGFSDTAFRIFIVMASRRLKSDRFFTRDFTPEVYSRVGYEWVNNTTMSDVLRRHYPELAPALEGVTNAFAPWNLVGRASVSSNGDARSVEKAAVGAP